MNSKARHWTFIVYPDSINEYWIDQLIQTGLPFAISPLHDKDINPDGSVKKSHYHVCITFDGPTTFNNVKSLTESIGATIPKRVMSLRGIYRYLSHEDNPDKYHYNSKDIKEFNNFHIDMTDSEITFKKAVISNDIVDKSIRNYAELVNYYLSIGDMDSFKIVSTNTFYFSKYIDSLNRL